MKHILYLLILPILIGIISVVFNINILLGCNSFIVSCLLWGMLFDAIILTIVLSWLTSFYESNTFITTEYEDLY